MRLTSQAASVILAIQHNADLSLQQISKVSGLPIHVIQYQLKRLREQGIIRRGVIVNPARLGLQLNQVYITGSSSYYRQAAQINKFLQKSPLVNWHARLGGEFQLGISIATRNACEVSHFLEKFAEKFSNPVSQKTLSTVLELYSYKKRFLGDISRNKFTAAISVSSDAAMTQIDSVDRTILGSLSDSTLQSNPEIARKTGIPRSTLEYRLKKLLESKVIERSVYYVNTRKLGYLTYRILISVSGMRSQALARIRQFAEKEPAVTFLIYSLGVWDFEIVIEVPDTESVMNLITSLHLACGDMIERLQTLPVFEQSTSSAFLALP